MMMHNANIYIYMQNVSATNVKQPHKKTGIQFRLLFTFASARFTMLCTYIYIFVYICQQWTVCNPAFDCWTSPKGVKEKWDGANFVAIIIVVIVTFRFSTYNPYTFICRGYAKRKKGANKIILSIMKFHLWTIWFNIVLWVFIIDFHYRSSNNNTVHNCMPRKKRTTHICLKKKKRPLGSEFITDWIVADSWPILMSRRCYHWTM